MTEQEQQTPGIRVMPPLVYAVSLFIGLAIEQLLPLVSIPWTWRAGSAVILISLAGLCKFTVVFGTQDAFEEILMRIYSY